ncbi:unnamed protein product, partial [Staurois parvus]
SAVVVHGSFLSEYLLIHTSHTAGRYSDRSAGDLHGISNLLIPGAMLYRLLWTKIINAQFSICKQMCIYYFCPIGELIL